MSRIIPTRPDPMPLREALRGLRHVLRRGGGSLADTLSVDVLPQPAADLAGAFLRDMGGLARNVDEVASGIAKSVLGGGDPPTIGLAEFGLLQNAGARFGEAVYVALQSVLKRLGAAEVFVSEAAARKVYGPAMAGDAATPAGAAASLTLALLSARVIRDAQTHAAAQVPEAAQQPVAIFAVLLWLQSARSDPENEAALDAATDLAVALAAEVTAACANHDAGRLAQLYEKYAPHV